MTTPSPALDLFKGRHFDRGDHCALCSVVPEFQIEIKRSDPDDDRTRNCRSSYDDSALGATDMFRSSKSAGADTLDRLTVPGDARRPI